jgi:hypothetical protein
MFRLLQCGAIVGIVCQLRERFLHLYEAVLPSAGAAERQAQSFATNDASKRLAYRSMATAI